MAQRLEAALAGASDLASLHGGAAPAARARDGAHRLARPGRQGRGGRKCWPRPAPSRMRPSRRPWPTPRASSSPPTARRAAPRASRSRSSCSAWASSAAASSISPPTSISSSSFRRRARPRVRAASTTRISSRGSAGWSSACSASAPAKASCIAWTCACGPFGDSGPLTVSGAFLDNYLQTHGRDWERYAWIKARAITGTAAYKLHPRGDACVRSSIGATSTSACSNRLREMKALIEKEVARRDLADHVKLGPGGIREIEFIVQAFQLIRGGQDRRMQTPSLLAVLPQLAGGKLLPARVAQELEAAYLFLRRLENRLQMLADAQTHRLPADALTRERIAAAMGFAGWESCAAELDLHRARVTRAFQEVMFARHDAAMAEMPGVNGIVEAWVRGVPSGAIRRGACRRAASPRRNRRRTCCWSFAARRALRRLDAPGRARLDTLLPRLLAAIADVKAPARVRSSTSCAACSRCSRPSVRARPISRCSTKTRTCAASWSSSRAWANSSPRRSPRIRCCSTSCWTKPRAACRRRAPSWSAKSTRASRTWSTTNPSARWKCCGSSSARRSFAWPWPISPARFR